MALARQAEWTAQLRQAQEEEQRNFLAEAQLPADPEGLLQVTPQAPTLSHSWWCSRNPSGGQG